MIKSKEEIRDKRLYQTPFISLKEAVDNAMQEFADQQTEELRTENERLKEQFKEAQRQLIIQLGNEPGN